MATLLGTPGDDFLKDAAGNMTIVTFDGNDTVAGSTADTVLTGNGNDQLAFGGAGGNIVYTGDGTDRVILSGYGAGNRVTFGFGVGDKVTGSVHHDYIVAPGNYSTIDGMGGSDTIILGGRHDKVIERFSAADPTGIRQGVDHIFAFNGSDRLVIEGFEPHPHWHQGPRGAVWVDDTPVAYVVGHHVTAHDLLFVT